MKTDGYFVILEFIKTDRVVQKRPFGLKLKPCLYKKRWLSKCIMWILCSEFIMQQNVRLENFKAPLEYIVELASGLTV